MLGLDLHVTGTREELAALLAGQSPGKPALPDGAWRSVARAAGYPLGTDESADINIDALCQHIEGAGFDYGLEHDLALIKIAKTIGITLAPGQIPSVPDLAEAVHEWAIGAAGGVQDAIEAESERLSAIYRDEVRIQREYTPEAIVRVVD